MTLIIGINLKDYLILAADRREVCLVNGDVAEIRSDNVNKIIDWKQGYITGSGYVPILSKLKETLNSTSVAHTSEILDLAVSSSNDVFNINVPFQVKNYWMCRTRWYLSYLTYDDNDNNVLRLAIVESDRIEGLRLVHEMDIVFSNLFDGSDALRDEISSRLKPLSEFDDLQDSIDYHVNLLPKIFLRASENLESVSRDYDVAIHLISGGQISSWS